MSDFSDPDFNEGWTSKETRMETTSSSETVVVNPKQVGDLMRLDDYLSGLQNLFDRESQRLEILRRDLSETSANVDQIKRMLDAAKVSAKNGNGPTEATAPKAKQRKSRNSTKRKPKIRASQETIDRVLWAIRQAGDAGITYKEIQDLAKISHDPVTRAVQILRNEGLVRKAGVNDIKAHIFKAMPETVHDEATRLNNPTESA